jgi:hypothetical protein
MSNAWHDERVPVYVAKVLGHGCGTASRQPTLDGVASIDHTDRPHGDSSEGAKA